MVQQEEDVQELYQPVLIGMTIPVPTSNNFIELDKQEQVISTVVQLDMSNSIAKDDHAAHNLQSTCNASHS